MTALLGAVVCALACIGAMRVLVVARRAMRRTVARFGRWLATADTPRVAVAEVPSLASAKVRS